MRSVRKRAVVASVFPAENMRMQWILKAAGFSEVVCVSDGMSALHQAQSMLTDLVVADAVLPVLDGPALAERIPELPLQVYPAVVLLAPSGMCPRKAPYHCVLDRPGSVETTERFVSEVGSLAPENRPVPEEKSRRIAGMLDRIGIPQHCGRDYLIRAIEMVWLDGRLIKQLTARLYPAVAKQFGADSRHVIRAMRHVIDEAWRSGEMDAQYELFGDTIDARRGSPTLGEMIAQIADILRWEGKA